MYRIAHFSDFHLADCGSGYDLAVEMIDHAVSRGVDHVVISGDIVDCAEIDVVTSFVDSLDESGIFSATKLTIVPGNHDIFPVSFNSPSAVLKSAANLGVMNRPSEIGEQFLNLAGPCLQGKGTRSLVRGELYPVGKRLSNDVCIVAMDSTRKRQYNPMKWSEGEIWEEEIDTVKNFFASQRGVKHRIVVMHHYPWREDEGFAGTVWDMVEPDPEKTVELLQYTGATLVLCGHLHCMQDIRLGRGLRGLMTGVGDPMKDPAYRLVSLHSNGAVRTSQCSFDRIQ